MRNQFSVRGAEDCQNGIYLNLSSAVKNLLKSKYSDKVEEYPQDCWHVTKSTVKPPQVKTSDFVPTPDEIEFMNILNKYRADRGLGTVVMNTQLMTSSRRNADYMRRANILSHYLNNSPDGVSPFDRAKKFGYNARMGENILEYARGYNPQTAFDSWLSSPPHRENIVAPYWKVMGIGYSPDKTVWVNMFGGSKNGHEIAPQ